MDENNILHTSISDISLMTKLMAVRHKTKTHNTKNCLHNYPINFTMIGRSSRFSQQSTMPNHNRLKGC
jgi:hypothetical protein